MFRLRILFTDYVNKRNIKRIILYVRITHLNKRLEIITKIRKKQKFNVRR